MGCIGGIEVDQVDLSRTAGSKNVVGSIDLFRADDEIRGQISIEIEITIDGDTCTIMRRYAIIDDVCNNELVWVGTAKIDCNGTVINGIGS